MEKVFKLILLIILYFKVLVFLSIGDCSEELPTEEFKDLFDDDKCF